MLSCLISQLLRMGALYNVRQLASAVAGPRIAWVAATTTAPRSRRMETHSSPVEWGALQASPACFRMHKARVTLGHVLYSYLAGRLATDDSGTTGLWETLQHVLACDSKADLAWHQDHSNKSWRSRKLVHLTVHLAAAVVNRAERRTKKH
jgi:hypothetical protein